MAVKNNINWVTNEINNMNHGYGNYVHLKQENYINYGLGFKEKKHMNINYNSQKTQLLSHLNKNRKYSNNQLIELKNFWQSLIYSDWKILQQKGFKYGDIIFSPDDTKELFSEMELMTHETIEDLEKLNSEKSSSFSSGSSLSKYKYRSRGKDVIYSSTIKKLLNKVSRSMSEARSSFVNGLISPDAYKNAIKAGKEYKTILQQLLLEGGKTKKTFEKHIKINTPKVLKNNRSVIEQQSGEAIELILFLKYVNRYNNNLNNYKTRIGSAQEALFTVFGSAIENQANQVNSQITKTFTGQKTSSAKIVLSNKNNDTRKQIINANFLLKEMENNEGNKKLNIHIEDNGMILHASQDTVDWHVGEDENSYLLKTLGFEQGIDASLKNYSSIEPNYFNPVGGVKIISETTLFSLFALWKTNFINHFLNIYASNITKEKMEMENMLRLTLAVRSLTGAKNNSLKQDLSNDLLIINNKQNKEIHIINVNNLITKISKDIDKLNKYIYANLNIDLKNNKIDSKNTVLSIKQRITKLVAQTHAIKLSATLSKNAIIDEQIK